MVSLALLEQLEHPVKMDSQAHKEIEGLLDCKVNLVRMAYQVNLALQV